LLLGVVAVNFAVRPSHTREEGSHGKIHE
jgi:hypothetical protein